MELYAQLPDPLLMIRTLDEITRHLVETTPQASFRVSTFRTQNALDVRPSVANVWLFYDLLLAEAETAVHAPTSSTPMDAKSPAKAPVKAMTASPDGSTPGPSPQRAQWPCNFWLTDGGCKQGQRCRWPHPWEGATDKAARCWTYSSLQHQEQNCPTKAQAKPVGGDGSGDKKEGGDKKNGKGKGKGKKGGKHNDGAGKNVKSIGEAKLDKESTGNGTAELLQEATKLLKSLHLPSVKMISVKEVIHGHDGRQRQILADSGATHSLRQAKSWSEWEECTPTVVALDQGTTSKLRLKNGTQTLVSEPSDESFGNGIIPVGALARIGYEVTWNGGSCQLKGPDNVDCEMEVVNACPMLPHDKGVMLMERVEI